MKVVKLEGEDQRLYYLVAHLVMNEEVLNYNLNYPYKTSSEYFWFIAVDKETTLGFIPVKLKEGKATINNYYVAGNNHLVFSALLKEAIRTLSFDFEIESVTQIPHIPHFEQCGFSIILRWKRFVKMKAFRNEKKCL